MSPNLDEPEDECMCIDLLFPSEECQAARGIGISLFARFIVQSACVRFVISANRGRVGVREAVFSFSGMAYNNINRKKKI